MDLEGMTKEHFIQSETEDVYFFYFSRPELLEEFRGPTKEERGIIISGLLGKEEARKYKELLSKLSEILYDPGQLEKLSTGQIRIQYKTSSELSEEVKPILESIKRSFGVSEITENKMNEAFFRALDHDNKNVGSLNRLYEIIREEGFFDYVVDEGRRTEIMREIFPTNESYKSRFYEAQNNIVKLFQNISCALKADFNTRFIGDIIGSMAYSVKQVTDFEVDSPKSHLNHKIKNIWG